MSAEPIDTTAVLDLLREVAARVIEPRFRALGEEDVASKSHPGDLVTVADQEAEVLLTAELNRAYPDAVVLGEETHARDAALLERFRAAGHAFTVDPVDGTRNFVHGSPDHAVMVSEVRTGEVVRAWIWQPQHRTGYVAERGAGAFRIREGERTRLTLETPGGGPDTWRVRTSTRRLIGERLGPTPPMELTWVSCGIDYPRLAEGACDALVYQGTWPWDHAPGSLLVREAGGELLTSDGERYTVRGPARGILAGAPGVAEELVAHL